MPVVQPTNTEVLDLKGLHLYHNERSNCSARVRLFIEEKGLTWENHHVDLKKKENISEWYFGINPKGLVPAIVHDGTVVIESNDILLYLEEKFPEPSLRNVPDEDQAKIDLWLQLSGDLHIPGIKTFQYYKRNARMLQKTEEEYQRYRELQTDPELLAFHAKHGPGSSFTEEDANQAVSLLDEVFEQLDDCLKSSDWIVGNVYTLADVSWGPTITTLKTGKFDFDRYPNIQAWYDRLLLRPEFQAAVVSWYRDASWGQE